MAGRNSYRVVAIISGFGKIYEVVTCNPRVRNIKWTIHMVLLLATEKNTIVNEEVDPKTWCSAYMDGTLYCCFRFRHETGKIGMFRIAKKYFGLTKMHSSLELEEEESFDFFELFECNGKLLLATRYFESNIDLCWRVYQFDDQDSRDKWSPIKSLGNRALAISTWPSDFDCDSVVVVHEAKEFADMIIDGNTTYMREIDERGSIWRKAKDHEWDFISPSTIYIEPTLFD